MASVQKWTDRGEDPGWSAGAIPQDGSARSRSPARRRPASTRPSSKLTWRAASTSTSPSGSRSPSTRERGPPPATSPDHGPPHSRVHQQPHQRHQVGEPAAPLRVAAPVHLRPSHAGQRGPDAAGGRCRVGRSHGGVCPARAPGRAVGALVGELDDHRCVVAGALALPFLAVDPGVCHPPGQCRQAELEVDPHALTAGEAQLRVVPVGIRGAP